MEAKGKQINVTVFSVRSQRCWWSTLPCYTGNRCNQSQWTSLSDAFNQGNVSIAWFSNWKLYLLWILSQLVPYRYAVKQRWWRNAVRGSDFLKGDLEEHLQGNHFLLSSFSDLWLSYGGTMIICLLHSSPSQLAIVRCLPNASGNLSTESNPSLAKSEI